MQNLIIMNILATITERIMVELTTSLFTNLRKSLIVHNYKPFLLYLEEPIQKGSMTDFSILLDRILLILLFGVLLLLTIAHLMGN